MQQWLLSQFRKNMGGLKSLHQQRDRGLIDCRLVIAAVAGTFFVRA